MCIRDSYARAFLEGRLSEDRLDHFRREVEGNGLSSYPHPRLMPDFWEYPTVSMGLGPINAIYQARFNEYLRDRGIKDTSNQRVWAFLGDGECDEPETLGALHLAARERLDNLTFVVNCNLQRRDGPVRGNSKIIQELEAVFRGSGWNVIKVVWGSDWDVLLEKDETGNLAQRMNEVVDGQYQKYTGMPGSYIREHFFGKDPRLMEMVKQLADEQLERMRRGGHDPEKVYSAFHSAVQHKGQPTVILAKTIKGYGLGEAGEGRVHRALHEEQRPEAALPGRRGDAGEGLRQRFDAGPPALDHLGPLVDENRDEAGHQRGDRGRSQEGVAPAPPAPQTGQRRGGHAHAERPPPDKAAPAWKAFERALALTRQNLPTYDRSTGLGAAEDLLKGGYVFYEDAPNGLQLVLIGTGSELDIAYTAAKQLASEGVGVRVVSLPSWELFQAQPVEYRTSVLPAGVAQLAPHTATDRRAIVLRPRSTSADL